MPDAGDMHLPFMIDVIAVNSEAWLRAKVWNKQDQDQPNPILPKQHMTQKGEME